MNKLALHWQILLALVLGALVGTGLWQAQQSALAWEVSGFVAVAQFMGDLFIQALKMLIMPLIVTAVIGSIAKLHGMKGFFQLGGKTLAFYLSSSLLAVVTGLLVVNFCSPGTLEGEPNEAIAAAFQREAEFQEANPEATRSQKVTTASSRDIHDISGIFLRMLPQNVFSAATSNGELLGVLVFSILFAIALTRLKKEQAEPIRQFFDGAHEAMLTLTRWIMAVAPLGLFGLICTVSFDLWADFSANKELGSQFALGLGKYFVTVFGALGIHFFLTLPALLWFLGRISPLKHYKAMAAAQLNAFSTASSSATLPLTMKAVEEKVGVSQRVSSFTLPLGATVNMDGTALYECVAVLFVAQVMGIEMGFVAQFFVVVLALLTSIGVAGIPSASMVAILLILKNAQIPGAEAAVGVLFTVDRLLDMSRTAVNITGDSVCAAVVGKSEGDQLFPSENSRVEEPEN